MSPWAPRIGLSVVALAVLGALISLSVGEAGPRSFPVSGLDAVQRTFAGIPQEGSTLGAEDAEVEIELFIDLRSVPGAKFEQEVVEPLVEELMRTRKAQIEIHHFSIGRTETTEAALAAIAAGAQGRQWQYAALVMRNLAAAGEQGVDREFLEAIAKMTPQLEFAQWLEDFDSPVTLDVGVQDSHLAFDLKLPAEPAIAVTGIGGSLTLTETPALDEVRVAIDRVSRPQ